MTRSVPAALLSFVLASAIPPVIGSAQAPAVASGQQPVRVGGDIAQPTKIKDVRPMYPAEAMASRTSGVVLIEATIDETGKVTNTRVIRSAATSLDQAALEAVRHWEYTPTVIAGKPVSVLMTVSVNFTLDGRSQGAAVPPMPGAGRRGGGPPPLAPAPYDLTGVWRSDDGGTYQIRTIGVEMFWTGKSDAGTWANVFHGGWSASGQYTGRFVELPPGTIANDGMISVRPVNQNVIEIVGSPLNFTARRWERIGPPITSGPPPPGPTRGIGVPGAGRMGAAVAVSDAPIPAGQFGAGAYRMGPAITAPRVTKDVTPQYTDTAMRAKISGTVLMEAVVLEDGTVGDVRVTQSLEPGLDKQAIAAAKEWRFTPAHDRAGRPVPVVVTIDLTFRLK